MCGEEEPEKIKKTLDNGSIIIIEKNWCYQNSGSWDYCPIGNV